MTSESQAGLCSLKCGDTTEWSAQLLIVLLDWAGWLGCLYFVISLQPSANIKQNCDETLQSIEQVLFVLPCHSVKCWNGSKQTGRLLMMDYKEIFSKINLRVEQILEHLAFLRYFDENPQYLQENVVKQALRR